MIALKVYRNDLCIEYNNKYNQNKVFRLIKGFGDQFKSRIGELQYKTPPINVMNNLERFRNMEYFSWIYDNINNDWALHPVMIDLNIDSKGFNDEVYSLIFSFSNEQDAMHFALRWI